ncbi:hypothetical protein Tco_0716222 [Tanacetum coccineum]
MTRKKHYPSGLYKSTVPSFDNAVLLWSPWNCLLVKNADTFIICSQICIDKFCAIIGTGYSQEDKNEAKTNKTQYEIGKSEKSQS